jgi:hypothetical protein
LELDHFTPHIGNITSKITQKRRRKGNGLGLFSKVVLLGTPKTPQIVTVRVTR